MTERKPIDIKRESGGVADIGSEEDGAILEMYNLNEKLMAIKERALYEFVMADSVDPEKTNINLPTNIQRLIINQDAESELVSRTFLTVKGLLKPELFEDIDTKRVVILIIGFPH